jgi:DNA-binding NtrC family response regulator
MTAQVRPLDPGDGSRALRPVILVVDDEPGLRESFRLILDDDYEVIDAADGPAALDVVRACQVDLVLLDIRLPGMDGIEVLERIKAIDEGVEVILVTAVKTVRTAVAAMKLGAFDYLTKPFEEDELLSLVRRALERRSLEREVVYLRAELERHHDHDEIVGQHPEMQKLYRLVAQVARTPTTVLITGESGAGKELVARAIHQQSPRRDKPFVAVNPAAIAETLMESELFGHEKGAFTGAFQRKLGRFELAQGGTLFLDEIATLKPELQAKLLRVLQEREIERVGGGRAIKIDVRIIAATNTDLTGAVALGAFREDLYYRLNVVHLAVPPLRERREDIPPLVGHFIRRYNHQFGKRIEGPTPEALVALCAYRWPGNVRELQNVIERSAVLVEGVAIGVADLPMELSVGASSAALDAAVPLNEASDRFERQMVLRALDRVGGNVSEAARALSVHRNSLKAKLARWKIRARDLRGGSAQ